MNNVFALAVAMMAAAAPAAAPTGPDDIESGTYVIDTKETLVRYGVMHMGFSEFWGTFPGATGSLVIDPKSIGSAKVEVSVPVVGVETTNRELNGELFSDEFFDAEKYPVMKFVSIKVTRTGDKTATIIGDLTMHGVTKEIRLRATFIGAGPNYFTKVPTIGFRGEGIVKRSDFGLGKYVPIVSDETTITISVAFEKK